MLRIEFYQVLSPNANDLGVWIHQDAWFHLGNFDKAISTNYQIIKSIKKGMASMFLSLKGLRK